MILKKTFFPKIIISGGQTGADRAALDFALETGLRIEGFCPKGRIAYDGELPAKYPLVETESARYPARTEKNVEAADATVIFNAGDENSNGTITTLKAALKNKKPHFVLRKIPDVAADAEALKKFLARHKPQKLNVAGNAERTTPGMYRHVIEVLRLAAKDR